jgi:RNA recognition motif-containing protein
MSYKLFIGSLAWGTDEDSLTQAFGQFGQVVSATVIKDRDSGRSKGFGFVEYATAEEGQKAIEGMNGQDLDGRQINVSEAKPREERPRR